MDDIIKIIVGIFTGVVIVAIVSVIVSRRSQTPAVIQAASSALANVVAAAVNPVNTAATNANLNAPHFSNPFTPSPNGAP